MYAVQARVTVRTNNTNLESTTDLPTFFLDENVQGITSKEDAERVAYDILTRPFTNHSASVFIAPHGFRLAGFVISHYLSVEKVS